MKLACVNICLNFPEQNLLVSSTVCMHLLCFYGFVMIKHCIWIRGCVWVHRESGKRNGMYTFRTIVSAGPPSVSLILVSSGHPSLSANSAMIFVMSRGSPLSVVAEEPFCHVRATVTSHAVILTPTTWATNWCVRCVLHGVCVRIRGHVIRISRLGSDMSYVDWNPSLIDSHLGWLDHRVYIASLYIASNVCCFHA